MSTARSELYGESVETTATAVLFAIAPPILVVDRELRIGFVNHAGKDFLRNGIDQLRGLPLANAVGFDNPLAALVTQAQARGVVVVDRAAELDLAGNRGRFGQQAAPIDDGSEAIVVLINATSGLAGSLDGYSRSPGLVK